MVIKQKIVLFVAILGLAAGILAFSPLNSTVGAVDCDDAGAAGGNGCDNQSPAGSDATNTTNDTSTDSTTTPSTDCTGDDGATKCCGGVKTSIISGDLCGKNDGKLEDNSVYKLLIAGLNILTAGIGVAAVGGIAYGAFLYTTAGSSAEQTKKAIGIISNVVVGLVAYALMYVFLNFLIPGGIFT